jgi:hypothetical protein
MRITLFMRRSNILTSPLSYPASTHRSSSLKLLPNATHLRDTQRNIPTTNGFAARSCRTLDLHPPGADMCVLLGRVARAQQQRITM